MQRTNGTIVDLSKGGRKLSQPHDEAKMMWLYDLCLKLSGLIDQDWLNEEDPMGEGDLLKSVHDFQLQIEAVMATIPARTAAMLAMKVELAEGYRPNMPLLISLKSDVERLTTERH